MSGRETIQIPLFDGWFLFNVYEEPDVETDISDKAWTSSSWEPAKDYMYVGARKDPHAFRELARLLKFRTCPFCCRSMTQVLEREQPGKLFLCETCNYWGGRGTREWGMGPVDHRGILGRYTFINNPEDVPIERLIRHLKETPTDLVKLSPSMAEQFVVDLVRDVLGCDARLIGGVRDHGIDGVILKNNKVRTIIQIKWRESSRKAETVSVVREVAGTLLSQGIPNGMIISTRSHYSSDAIREAERISQREMNGIGKLSFDLKSFDDIVGMLEVKCRTLNAELDPEQVIPGCELCIFDNH